MALRNFRAWSKLCRFIFGEMLRSVVYITRVSKTNIATVELPYPRNLCQEHRPLDGTTEPYPQGHDMFLKGTFPVLYLGRDVVKVPKIDVRRKLSPVLISGFVRGASNLHCRAFMSPSSGNLASPTPPPHSLLCPYPTNLPSRRLEHSTGAGQPERTGPASLTGRAW